VALAAGWNAVPPSAGPAAGVEVIFKRDASVYDGRFANNGWLQELPKPVTAALGTTRPSSAAHGGKAPASPTATC
jgi:hypothetical protein